MAYNRTSGQNGREMVFRVLRLPRHIVGVTYSWTESVIVSGIFALFVRDGRPIEASTANRILSACPDRNVDGQDLYLDGVVALGRQHFWVTPEEQGERQPLADPAAGLVLTADARIDNREELANALGMGSEQARRSTDAEYILAAYRKWGVDCPLHIEGDFVFAIWDERRRMLFLARDRIGTRGVFYFAGNRTFLAASEMSQILALGEVQPDINEDKVAEYLTSVWDDHTRSFLKDINYLPPAHSMMITADSVRCWEYWQIDPERQIRYRTDGDYAEHWLELFEQSVRVRLRTAGPAGLSLSGGLDSTSIAALAAPLLASGAGPGGRLKTFSYVFDEHPSCDENIAPVVERFNLDSVFVPGDDKWTFRHMDEWPVEQDFVFADAYYWLTRSILDAAEDSGVRVLLSGMYGDHLYQGSYLWPAAMLREGRLAQLAENLCKEPSVQVWRRSLLNHGVRPLAPLWTKRLFRRVAPVSITDLDKWIDADFIRRTNLRVRMQPSSERYRFTRPGAWVKYQNLLSPSIAQGLCSVRRFYHSRGLELALPFRDRRLIEFAMALPVDQLGRPGRTRHIMRNAMAGRLPGSVAERQSKSSFFPLLKLGATERELPVVAALAQQSLAEKRRILRDGWLRSEFDAMREKGDITIQFWLALCLELWLREFWTIPVSSLT